MKFLFAIIVTCIVLQPVVAQVGSDLKEDILSARQDAKEASDNKKHCEKLGFPASASDNRCFSFYPSKLTTWGKGFSLGLAKVTLGGKAGFINTAGKIVIPARFNDAGSFAEGLAPFEDANGKWGFIDTKGRIAIGPTFDWAMGFSEGFALIQQGELWGYIDRSGKVVIEPKFEEAESFSEDTAVVGYYDKDLEWMAAAPRKGKWVRRFIDKTGAWAIDKPFDIIHRGFDGGMAIVSRNLGYSEKYQGMISESIVIDVTGRELWKLDSASIHWFSDDAIVVEMERQSKNGWSLYNFRDRTGKLLCDSNYEDPSGFSEGLSAVRVDGKYGFIDKRCEFVIEPRFTSADGFSEGLAAVEESLGRKGYIDKSGKMVFESPFKWTGSFANGFALVLDGARSGYIDRSGNVIWKPSE